MALQKDNESKTRIYIIFLLFVLIQLGIFAGVHIQKNKELTENEVCFAPEYNFYSGPIPEGFDESYFRETGQTIPLKTGQTIPLNYPNFSKCDEDRIICDEDRIICYCK